MKHLLLTASTALLLTGCLKSTDSKVSNTAEPGQQINSQMSQVNTNQPVPEPVTTKTESKSTESEKSAINDNRPQVQLALVLDTSGSMSGMINQAKTQLWSIVNQFIKADRDGVKPRVQVALYHYGSPSLGSENGYIKQLAPLTDDLDKIAEELFKLKTSGGSEYCGWAIRTSVNELQWSKKNNDYKAIFIAGNESFAQGPVDYNKTCKDAIENGIIVNTIHCKGGADEGWKQGALLADGNFMQIDTNRVVAEVATPFDAEIAKLNSELNTTYVSYGTVGALKKERQTTMDSMSKSISSSNAAKRAVSKASSNYNAASWDLVDAIQRDGKELDDVEEAELPEEMQKMSKDERKEYITEQSEKRAKLQKQILELNTQRETFVADKQKELASNDDTLGAQVENAVQSQATKKGFNFKN